MQFQSIAYHGIQYAHMEIANAHIHVLPKLD
jgi:hypothetical protein